MLKINLRNQIRQTDLPKWKPLLPLFEAVMNSFQAIQAHAQRQQGRVAVKIEREEDLKVDDQQPITAFTITDNGVGFDDENFDSFNTSFTDQKLAQGGKGVGRFIWLKAFDRVEIDSVFSAPDSDALLRRKFTFDENYDPDTALTIETDKTTTGTVVQLVGFKEPFRTECPRGADAVAQRLVEHFLLLFFQADCPSLEIWDQHLGRLSANNIFENDFKGAASHNRFTLKGSEFDFYGLRLNTPRVSKHKLIYAANSRGVISEKLEEFVPDMRGRLPRPSGGTFVYLGIVQSPYLNEHVNSTRTNFDLGITDDADAEQSSLLAKEIQRSEIREACTRIISAELKDVFSGINDEKERRVRQYVENEAPQYKILMKYRESFISKIPLSATKLEMETALHNELHQRELTIKQEGSRIIKEAEKVDDYEDYQRRLSDFMSRYNELGVSALAQYVAHRKIILEFLERAISRRPGAGRYPLERVVHQLIFPLRGTTDDTFYSQQNLWIIDERLTYHSVIASDVPLNEIASLGTDSLKRPDLVFLDRPIAFADGDQPLTSVTVIEFKRPQRDDYTVKDNPLSQAFARIADIRSGQFLDANGRPVSVASDDIPAWGYVICDITPSLKSVLIEMDAAAMPDRQGYYGFHRTHKIYYEVIDYNKLLRDAQKRNRIFFDKLNVLSGW